MNNRSINFNDFELICRICLEQVDNLIPIFTKVSFDSKTYGDMLEECTSTHISSDDLLPKNICIDCSKYTEQSYKFRNKCLTSEKILQTVIDNLQIKNEQSLNRETINEINENTRTCESKDYPINDRQAKSNSKKLNKNYITRYQCENCSENFSRVIELYKHNKNIHLNTTIQCPFCKKKLTSLNVLKNHCTELNRCQICMKDCGCRNNLLKHKKTHEMCNICGKKFQYAYQYAKHKKIHSGERSHLCPYCGKAFTEYGNAQDHIRIHTGEKPYHCTLCDSKFRVSSGLKVHLLSHSNERNFTCETCNASYKKLSDLKNHMDIHKNIHFDCNLCDKQFRTKPQLLGHRRVHKAERKHVCTYCDKRFLVKDNLIMHIRTHTGEKPFACSICGRKFSHRQAVTRHEKIHAQNSISDSN